MSAREVGWTTRLLAGLVNRLSATSLVGIDVGTSAVKLAIAERRDGRIVLQRAAIAPIEGEEAPVVLHRLVRDTDAVGLHAALAVASPELIVRPVRLPPMPRKELEQAIRLEAEQTVLNGTPLRDMAMDWRVIRRERAGLRGLLAVVPKPVVEARGALARAAGLRPVVVDVMGLALWQAYQALAGCREPSGRAVLVMDIGASATTVVVGRGTDELILLRTLQAGAHALRQGGADEWTVEVRDSVAYARAEGGLRVLDAVYVTGGGSEPDTVERLRAVMDAPVTRWDPLGDVERDAACGLLDASDGPRLAVAIGLAARRLT